MLSSINGLRWSDIAHAQSLTDGLKKNSRRHGQPEKSPPLQWMRNRPNNLLNSTRGDPRGRARTPLPATAVLSSMSERLRPHRGWRGFTAPARAVKKSDFAKRTQPGKGKRGRPGQTPAAPRTESTYGITGLVHATPRIVSRCVSGRERQHP